MSSSSGAEICETCEASASIARLFVSFFFVLISSRALMKAARSPASSASTSRRYRQGAIPLAPASFLTPTTANS